MVFPGYFQLGGTELVNHARTAAYIRNQNPGFPFKAQQADGDQKLINALEDRAYASPAVDDAPWYDPIIPASAGFYGMYVTAAEGFSDSTRGITVTQSVVDGGNNGAPRSATRSMRIAGVLLGCDELALEAGMSWLRSALSPAACGMHDGGCGGSDLCFYLALPDVEERYEADYDGYNDYTMGNVTSDFSPAVVQFGRQLPEAGSCQPQRVEWLWDIGAAAEGLIASWGAMDLDGEIIYQEGPVPLYRVNRILNPSFTTGVGTWEETGAATLTWVSTGGVDDGGYAQMGATGVLQPITALDGGGRRVAASFALRASAGPTVTVRLRDADTSAVLATTTIVPTTDWIRYALPATPADSFRIEFTGTAAYDVDQVLVERSITVLAYFDGDSPEENFYDNAWSAAPSASRSTQTLVFSATNTANIISRPDPLWMPFFSVQQATAPNLRARAYWYPPIPVSEQLEQYSRHFHSVSTLSGPIATGPDRTFTSGAMRPVEIVFSAANPFMYSDLLDIAGGVVDVEPWADVVENLIPNPSGRVNTTGYSPSNGTNATSVGNYTELSVTGTPAAGAAYNRIALLTIGTDILPNTPYIFAAEIQGVGVDVTISVANDASDVVAAAVVADGAAFTRVFTTFTTDASGTVSLRIENAALGAGGDDVRFRDAILTLGSTLIDYFSGATTSTAAYTYAWEGTANNSVSLRTITDSAVALIQDPDCTPLPTPPVVPVILDSCIEVVNDWLRHWVEVDGDGQPATTRWGITDVVAKVSTAGSAFRQLRLRYYPDPFGYGPAAIDPESWCSEQVVSYLPANTTLTIDGVTRTIWASVAGAEAQPAGYLVYGTDGTPVTWPELSCGIDWLLSIDTPIEEGNPLGTSVDVELQVARRD